MQVNYLRGIGIEVPDSVMEVFNEWFSLWEGRLADGFDGETYRSAFALGYEVGLRNAAKDTPPNRRSFEEDDWPIPHGNC
jgi:hypothetical protein